MDWKLTLQIIGVALGLLYLYFEYKANIWLWVIGLIMPIVHGTLYFRQGLYADFSMELYYILAGIYGLIAWRRGDKKSKSELKISYTPRVAWVAIVGVYVLLHATIYMLLVTFTDSNVPWLDSFTTAVSVVGLWMLARKYVEQWIAWIAVDVVSTGLYIYKELYFTSALYAIYTIIAIFGYYKWKRLMQDNDD